MRARARILIVDDEANARGALSEILQEEGYATDVAADGFKALGRMAEFLPDVVLTDLKMPGLDGIGLMEKAQVTHPTTTFVVMTAFGSIPNAVLAVQKGAYDYLAKPLDFSILLPVVERAVERAKLLAENARLRDKLREKNPTSHIVGEHPRMLEMLELCQQVGKSRATALIVGETGTGKELVAELLHRESPRAGKAFVRLNCAALSESVLESELFGHERGAFTGALTKREGRFEAADGGTLLLDEVSEIPLGTQVKLLRVLQERAFERVGGNETVNVDVRILAASNKNLADEVKKGRFREDLLYRLNVFTIEVPPLRDRASDIMLLAGFFARRFAEENHKSLEGFSEGARAVLLAHPWPGNVRELENVVERAIVLSPGPLITEKHLPKSLVPGAKDDAMPQIPGATIAELERHAILKTLEVCHGSTTRAAAILGISPRKVQYKLREYALPEGEAVPLARDSESRR